MYYTLALQDAVNGKWGIEFGDEDRAVVKDEMRDLNEGFSAIPVKRMKIVKTFSMSQVEIDAAIAGIEIFQDNEKFETYFHQKEKEMKTKKSMGMRTGMMRARQISTERERMTRSRYQNQTTKMKNWRWGVLTPTQKDPR